MALVAMFCCSMSAQDVVLDFSTNTWNLPEGKAALGTDAATFTNGTYTIGLEAASAGYYFNTQGYLMLGKKDATLTLPAFDFDVAKIEVVGRKGASTSVVQNIFVGDVAVSAETTGASTADAAITNGYDIAADYQKAGNVYVLKVLSSHNTQITAINVYKVGSDIKKGAGLAFSKSKVSVEKGTEFVAPTFTKETTAPVTFTSDNEAVATVSAEGVISLGGAEGTAVVTATSEANDEYEAGEATCTIVVFTYNIYKKATSIESGKAYLIAAQRDNKTYYAYPIAEDKNYGYLQTGINDGYVDEIKVQNNYDDSFVFTTEGNGYSIKDCYGRYLMQSGTYKSFNLSETPLAWTVEAQQDGTFLIMMNGYTMQFGDGTYTSFGVYEGMQTGTALPMLYVYDEGASGINGITASDKANANAPIYNLAGQRVSKDTKGILIQNGKKFVNK